MKKIAIIVSSPMTIHAFMLHQVQSLAEYYDVTIIANVKDGERLLDNLPEGIHLYSIAIERKIDPLKDLWALLSLIRFFYSERFALIHSVSPKAGLLSVIAGWITQVPNRLHTFTGQVWATRSGMARWLFKSIDRVIVCLATTVLMDSHSQRDFLLEQGVVRGADCSVLEDGSISGVDLQRFQPDQQLHQSIRAQLNVDDSAFMVLFLGRLKRDKGVLDLVQAFNQLLSRFPDSILLIVGPDEEQLQQEMMGNLEGHAAALRFVPFTKEPEHYMAAADLFALPSYREGFGTVVIEAAACGIPTIASRIYGLSDAVVEGESGLLFEAGNIDEITSAMEQMADDEPMRLRFGEQAMQRAQQRFSQQRLSDALVGLYAQLLSPTSLNKGGES